VVRPLAQGPVADSWIYLRAARNLRAGKVTDAFARLSLHRRVSQD